MTIVHATARDFRQLIAQGPVMADFWAPWCGPCNMVGRALEELEGEFPEVRVVKVNVDEEPELASEFKIAAIPDIYFFRDGEQVDHVLGALSADALREKLENL